MAIIKNGQLSGLIGTVVAVRMKNEAILRSAPRKRSKNSWSEKQKQSWKRFAALTAFWKQFNFTPVQKIWKLADEGGRGINLFIRTNIKAFDAEGNLIEPDKLHLSAGELVLPHLLTAERSISDPGKIEVSWDPDTQQGNGLADDRLMMIASKDGKYSSLTDTEVMRIAGMATIPLPFGMEDSQAVYLSFSSEKRKMYSEDIYFRI